MKRAVVIALLLALSVTTVACRDKNPPQEGQPESAEKPAEESYFKNPAPPFEVILGEADQESPAAEFLESGNLRLPLLYREWIFVGSRFVSGTSRLVDGAGSMVENYYMHPLHYHKFRQDHAWPSQVVLVRERFEFEPKGVDAAAGEPRGVSAAVYDGRAETPDGGWQFFDFGESDPLANSAPPGGPAWFDSPDALLEFCPVLRGIKR